MAASALDSTGVDSPNAFRRSTVTEEAFVLHIKEAGIVRTRRKRLRKFRRCFSGADLVEWLATDSKAHTLYFDGMSPTVEQSIAFAQRLMDDGTFHELRFNAKFDPAASCLYRLRWDETVGYLPSAKEAMKGAVTKAGWLHVGMERKLNKKQRLKNALTRRKPGAAAAIKVKFHKRFIVLRNKERLLYIFKKNSSRGPLYVCHLSDPRCYLVDDHTTLTPTMVLDGSALARELVAADEEDLARSPTPRAAHVDGEGQIGRETISLRTGGKVSTLLFTGMSKPDATKWRRALAEGCSLRSKIDRSEFPTSLDLSRLVSEASVASAGGSVSLSVDTSMAESESGLLGSESSGSDSESSAGSSGSEASARNVRPTMEAEGDANLLVFDEEEPAAGDGAGSGAGGRDKRGKSLTRSNSYKRSSYSEWERERSVSSHSDGEGAWQPLTVMSPHAGGVEKDAASTDSRSSASSFRPIGPIVPKDAKDRELKREKSSSLSRAQRADSLIVPSPDIVAKLPDGVEVIGKPVRLAHEDGTVTGEVSVVWFRADLRVHDMPALQSAVKRARALPGGAQGTGSGAVVPLFIFCKDGRRLGVDPPRAVATRGDFASDDRTGGESAGAGAAESVVAPAPSLPHLEHQKLAWLATCVGGLSRALADLGSKLIVREVEASDDASVAEAVCDVARIASATAIHATDRYDPLSRQLDNLVASRLADVSANLYLHEPPTLMLRAPSVFAATFDDFASRMATPDPSDKLRTPKRGTVLRPASWPHSDVHDFGSELVARWSVVSTSKPKLKAETMARAWSTLNWRACLASALSHEHASDWKRFDQRSTSGLSPLIALGVVSVRQLWAELVKLARTGDRLVAVSSGFMLKQLTRREYCYHQIQQDWFEPLLRTDIPLSGLPWFAPSKWHTDFAEEAVTGARSWHCGATGYPLVDACMRCFGETGWLHQWGRKLVAVFWCKYLCLPWEQGMNWMAWHAADTDPALQAIGWLGAAGLLADPDSPHPASMGDPTGVEYAFECDPEGDFVRRWVPELTRLPSEWIHIPWQAPADVLARANLSLGRHYPNRVVTQEFARRRCLEAVQACVEEHGGLSVGAVGEAGEASPSHTGDIDGWPLLVEEDVAILLEQEAQSAAGDSSWDPVFEDSTRRLNVFLKGTNGPAKVVLATSVFEGVSAEDVFKVISEVDIQRQWDGTWEAIEMVDRLDNFNEVLYLTADTPPPPFSYTITQRDFVQLRHIWRHPGRGMYCSIHRNGAHPDAPENDKFVRAETLGVLGFVVRRLTATSCQVTCSSAADLKGKIPGWLVTFVAKRTAAKWADRVRAASEKFC